MRGDTTTSQSGKREGCDKRQRHDESQRRWWTGGVGETHLFCAFVSTQRGRREVWGECQQYRTLAARAWALGTFFQLWFCVSFWFWREIGFGLHTYVIRVQYSCGVVLVFWFWREIVFGVTYVLSVQYHCAVVSVFWLWRERDLKMRTRFYKKILTWRNRQVTQHNQD